MSKKNTNKKMVSINVEGLEPLEEELKRMSLINFNAVREKQVNQLFNRAKKRSITTKGGTPFDTGEMRKDISKNIDGITYGKEYSPHVEYGHRARNGRWVAGQRFAQKNAAIQTDTYEKDLLKAIKKG